MSDAMMGYLFALAGVFTLAAAILDWDWFMNHRRARLFVTLFGRLGARIVYALIGLLLMGLGLLVALGVFVPS